MNKLTPTAAPSGRHDADHPSRREVNDIHPIKPVAPLTGGAGLQHWRAQLHPDLQRVRPELLTPVDRPTGRQVVDVLEQLDALATIGGQAYVCEFAIEVINGLMSIIDAERLS